MVDEVFIYIIFLGFIVVFGGGIKDLEGLVGFSGYMYFGILIGDLCVYFCNIFYKFLDFFYLV